MNYLSAALVLGITITSAYAADKHDWYVLRAPDGFYAYDAGDITVSPKTGFKTLSLLTRTSGEDSTVIFTVDCHGWRAKFSGAMLSDKDTESLQLVEGNDSDSAGWEPVAENGGPRVAAMIVCKHNTTGAIHVGSQQAALDKLKTVSN